MAIEIGIELFIELQSVSRVPAVKANPWLGNVLSAKAVGKFSWGFWWLCLWCQVFGAFGMRRSGEWDAGSSANPRSAKRSAPGHWWSGADHTQAGGGNSDGAGQHELHESHVERGRLGLRTLPFSTTRWGMAGLELVHPTR